MEGKLVALFWLLVCSKGQDIRHVVDFQPNSYAFQSIGTNQLPPSLAGSFQPVFPSSTPRPEPSGTISSLRLRPTTNAPFFEEIQLTPSALTIAEDVISKTNEIVENSRQNSIVPIFSPNSAVVDTSGNSVPIFIPTTENQDPVYDYNSGDEYNEYETDDEYEYNEYNGIDDGVRPLEAPEVSMTEATPMEPESDLQTLPTTFKSSLLPAHQHENYHRPPYHPPAYHYHPPSYLPPEPEVIDILPPETTLDDPNLVCYERSCDQNITGTSLSYERALEIIQTEEYLTAADVDDVLKKKRKKREACNPLSNQCSRTKRIWSSITQGLFPGSKRKPRHNGYGYGYPPYIQVQKVPVLPPLIPPNVAQPGEPGGGDFPQNGDPEVLALVPRGLRPVSVFPPYLFPRTVPAKCVIWAEPDPKKQLRQRPQQSPKGSKISLLNRVRGFFGFRNVPRALRKATPYYKPRYYNKHHPKKVRVEEVPAFERRYGFRCKVTLVDRQQCQLGISCDPDGNRIPFAQSRQTGEEFFSDGPPECRTELSPLGCSPLPRLTP